MDYEKKYKDLIEAVKVLKEANPSDEGIQNWVKDNVPELQKSENERIRKVLVDYFEHQNKVGINTFFGIKADDILSWLEKQGEQEPTDKVEYLIPQKGEYYVCIKDYCPVASNYSVNTKDKIYKSPRNGYINNDKGVGLSWTNSCIEAYFSPVKDEDWIVCENNNVIGEPIQYKTLKSNKVLQKAIKSLEDNNFIIKLRFWTIQDAKNGDVLYAKGSYFKEYIFMFSSFTEDNVISTHFGYDVFHKTFDAKLSRFGRKEDFISVTPATKEQRDKLGKAMFDAGYKWNREKLKLEKI